MGLGKTLTSLVLILAKHFQMSGFNNHTVQSLANLIICPSVTLSNWETEIKIHFSQGALP
jgi:SNF2 family DNA or RNA helicase